MKNLKMIVSLFGLYLFTGCSNNDTSDYKEMHGQWSIINVSGSIAGVNEDFPEGTITWDFNTGNHTIAIVNNAPEESLYDGLESGNYDYGFVNSEAPESCSKTISINTFDYGCVSLSENTLIFNQTYVDGIVYKFKRNNLTTLQ